MVTHITNNILKLVFAVGLMLSLDAHHVLATETPPIPSQKQDLKDLETSLQQEKDITDKLEKSIKDKSFDIEKLRRELVQLTKEFQKTHDLADKLESDLQALETEETSLSEAIKKDRIRMAHIVSALIKIKQVPAPALLFSDQSPIDTARALRVLETTFPIIKDEAEKFEKKLEQLNDVKLDLAKRKIDLETKETKLLKQKTDMEELISLRQRYLQKDRVQLTSHMRKITKLAAEAESLKDLIIKIEKEKRVSKRRLSLQKPKTYKASVATRSKLLNKPSKDQNQPVQGVIKINFGAKDVFGASSQGIHIVAAPKSPVISPLDGIVRFVGDFKDYGNIVIIEHHGKYHSFLAGFGRIDTQVGQEVFAGEPIGILPKKVSQNPVLYFELRYNGEPVNPYSKLKSLG